MASTPVPDSSLEGTLEPSRAHDTAPRPPVAFLVRALGFFTVAVGSTAGLHYYLGVRLVRDAALPPVAQLAAWALLWLGFASLPLGMVISRARPGPAARALQWVSFSWMGAFALLLTATAATDVVALVARWLGAGEALSGGPLTWGQAKAGAVMALVAPAFTFGFLTARGKAKVEHMEVAIPGLGAAFDGLRIVQISDLHVGQTLGRPFLQRVVDQVNALNPDVVAVTGDLVEGTVGHVGEDVAPLSQLRAKHGVYYVTGNHEYYHGGPAWEREVARRGLTVLHNEHRVLRRGEDTLVVGGVTDYEGGHFGPENASRPDLAFAGAPEGAPRVLLAHQPRSVREASRHGVALQLSGHTHGGQIFPWMVLVPLQQPVVSGLKRLFGVQLYTHRGTGYWGPPVRLGPAPEIAELTLRRG